MTIQNSGVPNRYTGNGSVHEYDYTYKVFSEEDLLVTVLDPDTGEETELELDVDYSVDGVGDAAGGTVTLIDANQDWIDAGGDLVSQWIIVIERSRSVRQTAQIANQSSFHGRTHENAFDSVVMMIQQLEHKFERALVLPATVDPDDISMLFPTDILDMANKVLILNEDGDGFDFGPSVETIEEAIQSAIDAAASEAAASSSASSAASSASAASASASAAAASAVAAAASAAAALIAAGTDRQEVPAGLVNDVNVTFTLANTPLFAASVKLFIDGLLQRQGTDYTLSGTTITMAAAPETGQFIDAAYRS